MQKKSTIMHQIYMQHAGASKGFRKKRVPREVGRGQLCDEVCMELILWFIRA